MSTNTNQDWEANTFAGLEDLDDRGRERVSHLGRLDVDDEPEMLSSALPVMDELEIDDASRLA